MLRSPPFSLPLQSSSRYYVQPHKSSPIATPSRRNAAPVLRPENAKAPLIASSVSPNGPPPNPPTANQPLVGRPFTNVPKPPPCHLFLPVPVCPPPQGPFCIHSTPAQTSGVSLSFRLPTLAPIVCSPFAVATAHPELLPDDAHLGPRSTVHLALLRDLPAYPAPALGRAAIPSGFSSTRSSAPIPLGTARLSK